MASDDVVKYLSETDIRDAEAFRRRKETAILVMMFIDMVHSTALREKLGEVQFEKLRRQKKAELTAIIEKGKHGKVIKDIGDGLLGVFAIPDIAVRNALAIQQALASHRAFKVRIGLDMGQVTQESEKGIVKDVFGRHVNRAARLESLSEGGHVLVSYPIWDSAKGWLKHFEQIAWRKHGSYWLKGLSEPQMVYEPYNNRITKPLKTLRGEKVSLEDELTYCQLCGRYVKLKETFTCRTCGTSEICTKYCYDTEQRRCIECAAKIIPDILENMPENKPQQPSEAASGVYQPDFDVFFIYAPQNKSFIFRLTDYLAHEGLNVCADDKRGKTEEQIKEKITQGLQRSRFLVVCLSKHFNNSPWCRSEYFSPLPGEPRARNAEILPIIVGDYGEVDIPDFLYDKYYLDVRTKQGLERLVRKVKPISSGRAVPLETVPDQSTLPETLQSGLSELQSTLFSLSKEEEFHDKLVIEFDKIGIKLLNLLEHFPLYFDEFHEVITEYQNLAERMFRSVDDQEFRRVLTFRFRKVECCIEDLAGGFNCGDSFLGRELDIASSDSVYSFHNFDELEIEQGLNKLLSGDEIEESEGIDWLLQSGFGEAEKRLQKISELKILDDVLNVLWERFPRIFLHYSGHIFWDLLKYMLSHNIKWKLRFHALKTLLKRSFTANQASEILKNFIPEEQHILSAILMLHPRRECRAMAINILPSENRWDILLCPKVPWLIIRELVEKSCSDSSDSYIKALFLLLRPRLLVVESPLAIKETYSILNLFYHNPVFLQETFFHALIELHKNLSQKALLHPITKNLEQEINQAFQAFCSQGMLKDVDITEMTHIPLPIQRKLAHDGYLPKYFICNVRDVIATETIPHVERRPDIVNFLRLRRINARALEKLGTNKTLMREYRNRSAFCHNPKANTTLLRSYLSTLTRRDLKELSRDRNVSTFARELATKYLSRYK